MQDQPETLSAVRLRAEMAAGEVAEARHSSPGSSVFRKLEVLLDRERANWIYWAPVLFGAGALFFYQLAASPTWSHIVGVAGLAIFAVFFPRTSVILDVVLRSIGTFCAGFLIAKLHLIMNAAPIVPSQLGVRDVVGVVENVAVRHDGKRRMLVKTESIEGVAAKDTPHFVRVEARKGGTRPRVGQRIRFKARLFSPNGPVRPGGFDFARWAYFQKIGGLGFVRGDVVAVGDAAAERHHSTGRALSYAILQHRERLTDRIREQVPGQNGAIIAALISGDRAGLTEETNKAYRDSGLFHILSISGLHMAIMGGSIFFLIRFVLSLFPAIALRFAIKKWAAVAAICGAFGYLLISGGSVATVRSFLMIAVMFFAILLDRPALAVRNVAIAALLILVVFPPSVLNPGFQMSFAAVVALIVGYRAVTAWRMRFRSDQEQTFGFVQKSTGFVGGIVLSTLLASSAVAPIVAYHFHTSQQLAILANVLAVPVTNLVVMPGALGVLLLWPFGAEGPALQLMSWGVDMMTRVAYWVGGLPGAVVPVPAFSSVAFCLMIFGGAVLALVGQVWRLFGLIFVAVGLFVATTYDRPDLLLSQDGNTIAVRDASGRLAFLNAAKSTYVIKQWLAYDGDRRQPSNVLMEKISAYKRALACDDQSCVGQINGHRVAVVKEISALRDDCRSVDVLISLVSLPKRLAKLCRDANRAAQSVASLANTAATKSQPSGSVVSDAEGGRAGGGRIFERPSQTLPVAKDMLIIDRYTLKRHGAHALRLEMGAPPLVTKVYPDGYGRPWTRPLNSQNK